MAKAEQLGSNRHGDGLAANSARYQRTAPRRGRAGHEHGTGAAAGATAVDVTASGATTGEGQRDGGSSGPRQGSNSAGDLAP